MNGAFLTQFGVAPATPPLAIDLRAALLNCAGQVALVRQSLAAVAANPAAPGLDAANDAVLAMVGQFEAVAAELAAQMGACAALIDGGVSALRALDEYKRLESSDASDT